MYDKPQFEIPEAVRELAERNVDQARSAYNQFMEMARQVQETLAKSQGAMASGAMELQARVAKFAEENIQASFTFAPTSRAPAISRNTWRSSSATPRSRCRAMRSRPRSWASS